MVSGTETKAASLVLTVVCTTLWLFADAQSWGISQGCTLWQRLSYPFMHANILHLGINCWCLLTIAFYKCVPLWKLVVAYLIAVSYPSILMGSTVSVGLSGILFALFGLIYGLRFVTYFGGIIAFGFLLPHINATLHLYCYAVGVLVYALTTPLWIRK